MNLLLLFDVISNVQSVVGDLSVHGGGLNNESLFAALISDIDGEIAIVLAWLFLLLTFGLLFLLDLLIIRKRLSII